MGMEIVLSSFTYEGEQRVTIPKGVTCIAAGAFRSCRDVVEISLPSTLRAIEHDAFNGCTSLREITIPDLVETIGKRAFRGCSSLRRVTLPKTLSVLEPYTFSLCKSLGTIKGGDAVSIIGKECFAGCKSLTSIPFASGVHSIGEQAFSSCSSLDKMNLENSLKDIGSEAFRGCKGLKAVALPNELSFAGKNLFSGCSSELELIGAERLIVRYPDAFPKELIEQLGSIRPQDVSYYRQAYLNSHKKRIDEKQKEISELEAKLCQKKASPWAIFSLKKGRISGNGELIALEQELKGKRNELERMQNPSWETLVEYAKASAPQ